MRCTDVLGDVREHIDAAMQILVKNVGAELRIEKFSGENDERTDQQYGYDGNEDVGDDQAIAQAPKQSTAAPGNHAKNQIQRGEDRRDI